MLKKGTEHIGECLDMYVEYIQHNTHNIVVLRQNDVSTHYHISNNYPLYGRYPSMSSSCSNKTACVQLLHQRGVLLKSDHCTQKSFTSLHLCINLAHRHVAAVCIHRLIKIGGILSSLCVLTQADIKKHISVRTNEAAVVAKPPSHQ